MQDDPQDNLEIHGDDEQEIEEMIQLEKSLEGSQVPSDMKNSILPLKDIISSSFNSYDSDY